MARKSNQQQETVQPEILEGNEQVTVTDDQPVDHFTHIVREGKAKKLSPKTENHVFYEIAIHDGENELHIRMSGNEGGGLHSKEWIPLKDITAVLDVQGDKPFKSSVLKCVFSGQSANNAGFMAACCRGAWSYHPVGEISLPPRSSARLRATSRRNPISSGR